MPASLLAPAGEGSHWAELSLESGPGEGQKHTEAAAPTRTTWRQGPWGGGCHSGESPVSAVKKVLAGWIETCALIDLCVCECGCVCVCRTTVSGVSVLGLCPCSLLLAAGAGPLPGGRPCPWAPRLAWGQSLVRCGHFGVPGGRGGGATQLSSSLQRQEEGGHRPPELREGLAGGCTARHHHHCDGREKGHRPGLRSARHGQGGADGQAGHARVVPLPPLCTQTHSQDVRWGLTLPAGSKSWPVAH